MDNLFPQLISYDIRMPSITGGDLIARNRARAIYGAFIINQQALNYKLIARPMQLSGADLVITAIGSTYTTYEEQQSILSESRSNLLRNSPRITESSPTITQLIIPENISVSGSTVGLSQIDFTGISDAIPRETGLDDAFVPIPMGGMAFNFFGTNYSNSISWYSNNAFVFGTTFDPNIISISRNTAECILIGNYDRACESIYYSNTTGDYSITKLIINFYDVWDAQVPYKYQIRFIKENIGAQRQFIEVCVVTSPPSPGYSSGKIYPTTENPSGIDASGNPIDSREEIIDQTKTSPYNITNGTTFLNPCGTIFSMESPPAGTSFIFSSDSTGTDWTFANNSYINV